MNPSFTIAFWWTGQEIVSAIEYAAQVARAPSDALVELARSHANHGLAISAIYLATYVAALWYERKQGDQ